MMKLQRGAWMEGWMDGWMVAKNNTVGHQQSRWAGKSARTNNLFARRIPFHGQEAQQHGRRVSPAGDVARILVEPFHDGLQ